MNKSGDLGSLSPQTGAYRELKGPILLVVVISEPKKGEEASAGEA